MNVVGSTQRLLRWNSPGRFCVCNAWLTCVLFSCAARETGGGEESVPTQGSTSSNETEGGGTSDGPHPPDLGAGTVVCGAKEEYATTNESIALLSGCEDYLGSIVVPAPPTASDLSPLSSLRIIRGLFAGNNGSDAYTIDGLERLEWVGSISFSDGLSDLSALSNLTGVEDSVQFLGANSIVDFRGLENLRTIGGQVALTVNASLVALDGLSGLEWIGGDLSIVSNPEIASLQGLSNLRRVEGDVMIVLNEKLPASEIDALLAHIEVGGEIRLE